MFQTAGTQRIQTPSRRSEKTGSGQGHPARGVFDSDRMYPDHGDVLTGHGSDSDPADAAADDADFNPVDLHRVDVYPSSSIERDSSDRA